MNRIPTFNLREPVRTQVLLTGSEAFPVLERAFLDAEREVWGSFRLFDLRTRLRSDRARRVGDTWFDLVVHTLKRGVRIRMALADFDPIARPRLHRRAWHSTRMFLATAELAGPEADLDVIPAMHAAKTGIVPRLATLPFVRHSLNKAVRWLNEMSPDQREGALANVPGLTRYLKRRPDGRVQARLDCVPELFPATHHQKLAVIDRRILYIGGLDLDERRFDDPEHDRPGEETWHDVQLLLEGPVVAEAQAHLEAFLAVVAGRADPPPQRRLVRTISRRRQVEAPFFGPEPVANEIAVGHELLANRAERLIYLETQFLRDRAMARTLARAAEENPKLSLLVVLPAAPEDIAFEASEALDSRYGEFLQWRCMRRLVRAFGRRFFAVAAAQPRHALRNVADRGGRDRLKGAELVYIHSKVSIFDEREAIVSSANLNGRSLRWDTEAGVFLSNPKDVAMLKRRLFEHWLPDEAGPEFHDPETAVEAWRRLSLENAARDPADRRGFVLPYDIKAAERHAMPLPGIPEEMV